MYLKNSPHLSEFSVYCLNFLTETSQTVVFFRNSRPLDPEILLINLLTGRFKHYFSKFTGISRERKIGVCYPQRCADTRTGYFPLRRRVAKRPSPDSVQIPNRIVILWCFSEMNFMHRACIGLRAGSCSRRSECRGDSRRSHDRGSSQPTGHRRVLNLVLDRILRSVGIPSSPSSTNAGGILRS